MKLSRSSNSTAGKVRRDISFVDLVQSIINYSQTFEAEYNVSSLEARVSDIAEDMMSSEFLEKGSSSTYRRYARISRLFLKSKSVFEIVKTVNASNSDSDKKLSVMGVTNLDDNVIFSSSEEDFAVYVRAAFMYIARPERSSAFNSGYFYGFASRSLSSLKQLHAETEVKLKFASFQEFLESVIPKTKTVSISIIDNFLNIVSLFEFSSDDQRKISKVEGRMNTFITQVRRYFFPSTKKTGNDELGNVGKDIKRRSRKTKRYNQTGYA